MKILRYRFVILLLGFLIMVFFKFRWTFIFGDKVGELRWPILQQHGNRSNISQTQMLKIQEDLGFSKEEWDRIQRAVYWGEPDRQITSVTMCTSPDHSTFIINDFKDSYYVGEELHATIVAKDCTGRPKSYGGDFFQAKAYSNKLNAGVFGEVLDHHNGTYTARFTLPWAGEAFVAIRLIHSSEGVQILKQHRDMDPDRVNFYGFFVGKNKQGAKVEEKVDCNVKWDGVAISGKGSCCCEYPDVRTGLMWHCRKPPTLPCNTLVYYTHGVYKNHMTDLEKEIMDKQHVNRWINGDSRMITVLASNSTLGVREACKPGMPTPIPAGFYLDDVWTSFVCATRHFNAKDKTKCLKDHHIYIMGDSTSRQWYDFIIESVPTLRRMNQHTIENNGPHMAVDVENNIDLHYRSHGTPRISVARQIMADLHYISNEIDDMAGGPHTVIVFNVFAHFTTFPLSYFAYRVSQIRRAVVALLRRAPETKVIMKTANTGHKDFYRSDWLSMQLDRVLRETFNGVGVYILDVWQMTACHHNTEDIHPGPVIIKNEVDILLSFICPT
ncbi:NXPE family member 3-like isoform X3 [Alosa sapidissima]|uniref:NXPE family member 3-like isoform X3 n=1 Tax=Alosa sapidissima TaxID=34773 RepID=UPI001C092331|nr:NXPE family member 3-like isoform X3 [Alosa sapidissima]XP_041955944.1 NXPE family member 3-like isoform X3 [Alosa sapidissima]XP_041955945.1 NXPE family member 3-like isoform X3 [Alosa sapidissima]XP_041955946.1 NXPE family member 3-like isoform X3 [Alosa sapidissima]